VAHAFIKPAAERRNGYVASGFVDLPGALADDWDVTACRSELPKLHSCLLTGFATFALSEGDARRR
jgi:hypothetical protein